MNDETTPAEPTEVNVNVTPSTDHSKESHKVETQPAPAATVEVDSGDITVTVSEGE